MRVLLVIAALAFAPAALAATGSASANSAAATGPAADRTLVVGVKQVKPFAMKTADGHWHGISIELWEDIAKRLKLRYRYRQYDLEDLLNATAHGDVDVAVAAITVTADRESRLDFTQPFFQSSLAIAVPLKQSGGVGDFFRTLISVPFLTATGTLLLVLAGMGALIWLIERRRNPDFGGSAARGLGDGLWWSAVTMTTVGYGDKAPKTFAGRALAVIWMFASIIIIASMTGAIASAFTVTNLNAGIQGPSDLPRYRIATVTGSTSEQYLESRHIRYRSYATLDHALQSVVKGVDAAVVYDSPAMKYLVNERFANTLQVLPDDFRPEYYAFALPLHSPLRKPMDRALLDVTQSSAWGDVLYGYFGD